MTNSLLVGFRNTDTSLGALRWAIDLAHRSRLKLTVLHAASIPIAVRNGPSRAVAYTMGDPTWATVHSVVQGFAPPPGTNTIVEGGREFEIIAKHACAGDLIVLGSEHKRWARPWSTKSRLRRRGHDVRVIEIGSFNRSLERVDTAVQEGSVEPSVRLPEHRPAGRNLLVNQQDSKV